MKYLVGPANDQKTIKIELPAESGQRILFSLSGGADSAILLYMLAKVNRDAGSPHTIHPATFPRDEMAATFANGIIDFVNQKLRISIPQTRVHGTGKLAHNKVVQVGISQLMGSGDFDYVYVAENRVPEIALPGMAPVRANEKHHYKRMMLPFASYYKYHIVDLYFREGIPELLALTHSCTQLPYGRCGQCFQDHEREWAFQQLGYVDPGTV